MKIVTNINNTPMHTCKCGSWLAHWQNFSGQASLICPEINCNEPATDGAHVQLLSGLLGHDQRWYIVPLCRAHNHAPKALAISDNVALVSANKRETCERQLGIISGALAQRRRDT